MKKLIKLGLPLFAVAILSVAFLASCNNPCGKMYKCNTDHNMTMEFLRDSTVILKGFGTESPVATYRQHGRIIIVSYKVSSGGSGNFVGRDRVFRILDDSAKTLLDDDGQRWTKM